MYYFIPSWYSKTDKWSAVNSPWYQKSNEYEFDDTINQVRMFLSAGERTNLVILSYFPQLRHFMHQQNIAQSDYWSVFDEIQGIGVRRVGILSYEELDWPENIDWVFNPFAVLAYRDNELYARVEFAEDGNLSYIEYYLHDVIQRRSIYDDRGFLSSEVFFQDGKMTKRVFYNDHQVVQFTEDLITGRITLGQRCSHRFRRMEYKSVQDVIKEAAQEYFRGKEDLDQNMIVIAANEQHDSMLTEILRGERIALSFFDNRFDLDDIEALKKDVSAAKFVVTDTEHVAKMIRNAAGEDLPIYDISPFDTRLSLGKSQRIKELKIFMPIDGLTGIYLEKALTQVMQYMDQNPDVVLLLGTRGDDADELSAVKEEADRIQKEKGIGPLYFDTDTEEDLQMDDPQTEKKTPRLFIARYNSENDLIRILYDTRLILDVRDQPDLYLQIAGISAGIPQVNYRFTRYVEHQKDGYIIQNINYITGALEYYLSGLAHWNEALVYCVQEISKYTGGNQVRKWKEMEKA